MEHLFDDAALLQQIADGIAADDPRLARRLAAGPMGLWRQLRRASGAVVLVATSVAVTGLVLDSPSTVALGASFIFFAFLFTAGITLQLRVGDRIARQALGHVAPTGHWDPRRGPVVRASLPQRLRGVAARGRRLVRPAWLARITIAARHRVAVARFRFRLRRA